MSQEAIHHIPDFHFDYYCIVPHTIDPQVLMLRDENGWSLPYFVPYEHHYGVVGHIGFRANGIPGATNIQQVWRMDYHWITTTIMEQGKMILRLGKILLFIIMS